MLHTASPKSEFQSFVLYFNSLYLLVWVSWLVDSALVGGVEIRVDEEEI